MDEKMIELIAIGASVAAHCQPCLTYHAEKAAKSGATEAEIAEAIKVGKMVTQGATAAMDKFSASLAGATQPDGECCCSAGCDCKS